MIELWMHQLHRWCLDHLGPAQYFSTLASEETIASRKPYLIAANKQAGEAAATKCIEATNRARKGIDFAANIFEVLLGIVRCIEGCFRKTGSSQRLEK